MLSFFLVMIALSLGLACEKEKGLGQYSVAISYSASPSTSALPLLIFIDGKEYGELLTIPNVLPTYAANCEDLIHTSDMTNVFVTKRISRGKHKVTIKQKDGPVIKDLAFEMLNQECVFQTVRIILD